MAGEGALIYRLIHRSWGESFVHIFLDLFIRIDGISASPGRHYQARHPHGKLESSTGVAETERARLLQVQGGHNALDKVVSFLPDMVGRFKFLVGDLATVRQR